MLAYSWNRVNWSAKICGRGAPSPYLSPIPTVLLQNVKSYYETVIVQKKSKKNGLQLGQFIALSIYRICSSHVFTIFKREKASARASSDRFCPVLSCLPLSLISSHIPNNVTNYKYLGKQEPTIDFGNVNNQLSLKI